MGLELPPLWSHQVEAIARAKRHGHYAFFFDMGTGKSRTTIEMIRHHCNSNRRMMRTLILCPRIMVETWKEQILKFSQIKEEKIFCILGDSKKRDKIWDKVWESETGIVIVNYDKLVGRGTGSSDTQVRLLQWSPEILVCDESHLLKESSSGRSKSTQKLARLAEHRYILSGTPVLASPLDLFAQFLILDQGRTLGEDYWKFKLRYMIDKNAWMKGKQNYFPNWQIKAGAIEELNARIADKSMSVKKSDCLDLPPLVKQRIYVEMTPEQAKMYKEMKKDLITFINDEAVVAQVALTKALRLQQIASGYVKTESGKEISLKHTPKQEALKELLAELTPHHKVVVWAVFAQNYQEIRKICEELKLEYVEIHGEIVDKAKFENVQRFERDDVVRVVIAHPGSGGVGISLVASSYSIFYSRGFSLGNDLQAEARNYRSGSERHDKVTRIDLVTKGTIDELVLEQLELKQEIGDSLLKRIACES